MTDNINKQLLEALKEAYDMIWNGVPEHEWDGVKSRMKQAISAAEAQGDGRLPTCRELEKIMHKEYPFEISETYCNSKIFKNLAVTIREYLKSPPQQQQTKGE